MYFVFSSFRRSDLVLVTRTKKNCPLHIGRVKLAGNMPFCPVASLNPINQPSSWKKTSKKSLIMYWNIRKSPWKEFLEAEGVFFRFWWRKSIDIHSVNHYKESYKWFEITCNSEFYVYNWNDIIFYVILPDDYWQANKIKAYFQ